MNSIGELMATLREVDKSKYPELSNYTKDEIWREIGPGGLYLVSLLAKELSLAPNSVVLDLGCGSAQSSLYLANKYRAKVIAADLWTDPAENARRIESRGHRGAIIPLRLDASKPLPFAEEYFYICHFPFVTWQTEKFKPQPSGGDHEMGLPGSAH